MFIMLKRSTKRVLISICLISIVVLGYWGLKYKFNLPEVKGKTLLTYIPGNIKNKPLIAVAGINNIKNIYGLLRTTNFFKALINSKLCNFPSHSIDKIMGIIGKEIVVAVFGAKYEDLEYVVVSRVHDITGLKEFFYKTFGRSESIVQKYRNVEINFNNKVFYCIFDGMVIKANSVNLIKDVIDIKNQVSTLSNFNSVHSWVEEKMSSSADGFIFTSNREVAETVNEVAREILEIQTPTNGFSVPYTFHELYINRGLFIKSYSKLENEKAVPLSSIPTAIRFIPTRILLANLQTNIDIKKWEDNLSRYININFKEDVMPYLAQEFGYVILGPSRETISLAFPDLVVYGEVKDAVSQNKLQENIKKILKVKMDEVEYSDLKYNAARIPVFMGQKIEVCVVPLKVKGKRFVAIATSRKVAEDIIDVISRRKNSLGGSSVWREISRFLPEKFSIFSYADLNALSRTVGLFIASLSRNEKFGNFLKCDPFSWIGPAGSASIFSSTCLTVHTYFPTQDLTLNMWKKILESLPFIPLRNAPPQTP